MIITVGGHRVQEIVKSSLAYSDKVSGRATCAFIVPDPGFDVDIGMEVTATVGGDVVFRGTVDGVEEFGDITREVVVSCVDFSQLIDRRVVYEAFDNMSAGDMVQALIAQVFCAEGVTAGNIQAGAMVRRAVFNYDRGNVAMDKLADLTGFVWYIDHLRRLNFHSRTTYSAPFALTEGGNYYNFRVRRARGQYRNRQFLRAGHDTSVPQVLRRPTPRPDGVSRQFFLRLPVAKQPLIFIDGAQVDPAEVGVHGLHTDKKWYFSSASTTISQDDSEPVLQPENVLEVTYQGLFPIVVVADAAEQVVERQGIEGGSGLYENVMDEPGINEKTTAFEFVLAKLKKHGLISRAITFSTGEVGLKSGQLLMIKNALHSISDKFLIEKITGKWRSGRMEYTAQALDGTALGGWEQFFRTLIQSTRQLVIRENEILTRLNVLDSAVVCGDAMVVTAAVPESRIGYVRIGFGEVAA